MHTRALTKVGDGPSCPAGPRNGAAPPHRFTILILDLGKNKRFRDSTTWRFSTETAFISHGPLPGSAGPPALLRQAAAQADCVVPLLRAEAARAVMNHYSADTASGEVAHGRGGESSVVA